MMEQYLIVSPYIVKAVGVGVVLLSFALLISVLAVRPEKRDKGQTSLMLFQVAFEATLGAWLCLVVPFQILDIVSLFGSTVVVVFVYSLLVIRLYFINILRSMFGK